MDKSRHARETRLKRRSFVLGDEEDKLLVKLTHKLGLVSKSAGIRLAIHALAREEDYKAIKVGYLKYPETEEERKLSEAAFKSFAKDLPKEEW